MTEQERPEGAVPTEVDSPEPTPEQTEPTMISEVDVDRELAEIEDVIREGEPLPVGANDPEVLAAQPADPPGMPHQPDDLDREMAAKAQDFHDYGWGPRRNGERGEVRPDSATIHDARNEALHDIRPRNVREALLCHAADEARRARVAVQTYAKALVEVQIARDEYVAAVSAAAGAEEALFVMGLDIEADHDAVEPDPEPEPVRIPDANIL